MEPQVNQHQHRTMAPFTTRLIYFASTKTHINVILQFILNFSSVLFPYSVPVKNFYAFVVSSSMLMSYSFHLRSFTCTANNFSPTVQITSM